MTETMMLALRPCPFCGATSKDKMLSVETLEDDSGKLAYAVVCDNCGAMGPAVEDMKAAKQSAIETCANLWNG